MEEVVIKAPAKINLCLDIKGLREDGYHEVDMIMQSIALYDRLHLQKSGDGIKISTNSDRVPTGRENLAYKAAELILDEAGLHNGVNIHIEKNIPVAAGLAGGSTDAAAVLKGINQLYGLNFSYNRLVSMARKLGSDVPFCLQGGTARATGRGDYLTQLDDLQKTYLVVVTPPVALSTAYIYSQYDKNPFSGSIPVTRFVNLISNNKKNNLGRGMV